MNMISASVTYRERKLAIVAAFIAWTILVIGEVLPAVNRVTQGFAAYYAASYAVLHGGAAALINDAVFPTWVVRSGISGIHEVFAGNVPTFALFMIPLTSFRPEIAQTIWLIVNIGLLIACAWLASKICAPRNPAARWWIAAVFALLAPVAETVRYGQVYLLLAFLSLVAVAALRKRQDFLAGIAVGAMLLIKPYYGALSLGVLIWARRPRSIGAALAIVGLVVIGSLPLLADAWLGFLPALLNVNDVPWAGIAANQTLNSLTQHLFLYTPTWNPEPLLDIPWFATMVRYGLSIALVGITLSKARWHNALWLWPPALALMPILAPVGETHHYTLLLLPVAAGIIYMVEGGPNKQTIGIIGLGLLLLIVPWPSLNGVTGWGSWNGLLAYPRLLGGVLLWAGVMGSTPLNSE